MLRFSLLALLTASAVTAQSPLTTLFAQNNSGAVGGGVYFNLSVAAAGVTVTQLDVNLISPASTTGTIEVWILPGGSHVGNENSNANWLRLGSAPVTAAGANLPSVVNFSPGLCFAGGRYGVALCAIGVAHAYTNGNGSNQTYSNAELTLNAGSALNVCFGPGTPFSPRVVNCSIHYTIGASCTYARAGAYGAGCMSNALSFYELFAPGTFDLAGTPTNSILLTPAGGGYSVTAGTNTFVPPASTGLALTDDSLSAALSLPGSGITFPGGSTTQIKICSNGYVWLNGTATVADFSPTVTELLNNGPRLCPMWGDLLPDGATNTANCYYDVVGSKAYCTWLNVPEYGGGSAANTFQVAFDTANNSIEISWQACGLTLAGHNMITGFSPGAANRDPGSRDISATLPFSTQASDQAPLALGASARPIMGTTPNLLISEIPAGSLAGVLMVGLPLNPGVELGFIGMPRCYLLTNPQFLTLPFATGGTSASVPFPIPAGPPNLAGVVLGTQAATISPGQNAAGIVASNGLELQLGAQ